MGEVFAGRYELVDPIGRGGVGAVWRAWDHRRVRYVAAKVLQQSDAHTLLRFVREQALRIDHPHVLAPASWAADDDKVLFTMDLVSGGSLAHLVGDYGPLPPRFVCVLLDQLLSGLTAVHAEDVVHRDIKPANILLESTGTGRPHLRLSDFGISMRKGEPRLTETNYVVGTPGYFAPEQMLGAEPDFPADLFAVGLVALYLLTGAKPDAQALIQHFARHGTPGAPEGVPEPLWQVLANLVQPDPQARFRTATGARKALLAAVELLPEPTVEEELVEVFDHIGPLPAGFGPTGPLTDGGATGGAVTGGAVTGGAVTGSRVAGGPAGHGPATGVSPGGSSPTGAPSAPGSGTVPPQPEAAASGAAHTPPQPPAPEPAMSQTGSFQLAPPQQPAQPPTTPPGPVPAAPAQPPSQHQVQHQVQQQAPSQPQPVPLQHQPVPPYEPTTAARQDPAATRPYTAPPAPVPAPQAPQRRPGPPPKVAVPVLVLALLCIAVGVWALSVS